MATRISVGVGEWITLCARRHPYKVPAEFRVEDSLPMNASGKILKRELRLHP